MINKEVSRFIERREAIIDSGVQLGYSLDEARSVGIDSLTGLRSIELEDVTTEAIMFGENNTDRILRRIQKFLSGGINEQG